jgi:hypothetical protein
LRPASTRRRDLGKAARANPDKALGQHTRRGTQ